MRNATAEGGIVREKIRRVLQRIRKISCEDEKQDWAQDTALCTSASTGRERREREEGEEGENFVESPMLTMKVEEFSRPREEVALDVIG